LVVKNYAVAGSLLVYLSFSRLGFDFPAIKIFIHLSPLNPSPQIGNAEFLSEAKRAVSDLQPDMQKQ